MSYWQRIHHRDPRAVAMADRHYSRQHPGSPEFMRPGHKIVLMHFCPCGQPAAIWGSQRPAPGSGAVRADGLDAWDCAIFRIERATVPASELIREAVAITAAIWSPLPRDGFVTTVDPRYVAPIKRRGKDVWGYCYLKAGWSFLKRTKARDLVMLQLSAEALAAVQPLVAAWDMGPLFTQEAA